MHKILIGNGMMVACSIFYLLWWGLAFRPGATRTTAITVSLLAFAFVTGVAGLLWIGKAMQEQTPHTSLFPDHAVMIGGIAVYLILLILTSRLLKRQVTTELFLIVGWAMLEISIGDMGFGCDLLSRDQALILCTVVVTAAVISLVCYMRYYDLEAYKGYYDGMIPLILSAVVMIGVNIACW